VVEKGHVKKGGTMRSTSAGWLIATALAGTACHSMTPLSWREIGALRPPRVYVTHADKSIVEMSGPQVFGDTLVGYINGQFQEVPTAEIRRVAMKRPDRAKTIALIAGSTTVAVGVAVWMASSGIFGANTFLDCADVPDDPRCT
jgi:hypothetical protein